MKCFLFLFLFVLITSKYTIVEKPINSLCSEFSNSDCKKCKKGYFLLKGTCYEKCPNEYVADNLSNTCKKKCDEATYIKAYTISRCVNQCGIEYSDCSCNSNCRRKGNCCSDFKICEIIQDNYNDEIKYNDKEKEISNCLYDSLDHQSCLQCEEGFYLYMSKCYSKCPENFFPDEKNKICNSNKKCANGKYNLNDDECVDKCPIDMLANRINFKCENKNSNIYIFKCLVYSFYWIFPSKNSCKKSCGIETQDCSCNIDCKRKADCCDDYDKFCFNIKENDDENMVNGKFKNNTLTHLHLNSTNSTIFHHLNNINKHLPEVFKTFFNGESNNNTIINKGLKAFNGKVGVNVYSENKNLKIVKRKNSNSNSHNNKEDIVENINTKNIIKSDDSDFNMGSILQDLNLELKNDLNFNTEDFHETIINNNKFFLKDSDNLTKPNNESKNLAKSKKDSNKINLLIKNKNNTSSNLSKIEKHNNFFVHNHIFVNDDTLHVNSPHNSNTFHNEDNQNISEVLENEATPEHSLNENKRNIKSMILINQSNYKKK